jgi:serine/threonine-protein kinase HipA
VAKPISVEVRLHGRRVGVLDYDRGGSAFTYEDSLALADHRVLGQIFEDDPRVVRQARVGLPAWFANLLPEGALRQQIVREMGGGNIGDFTLLLRLGGYLPGAVSVHGEAEPSDDTSHEFDQGAVPDHPLRHSLAGFQLKYTVSADRLTFPVSGEGKWWIAKLPDRALRDLTVNEYLTMRWLADAGFPVPPVHLMPAHAVGGIPDGLVDPAEPIYLIERFDRVADGRVHVEDFAQVADVEPMFKYSQSGATYDALAAVVHQLAGPQDYADYVRRLVAMLVIGNTDAHLKNWALIYPDGRLARLAPVYDFHSLTIYNKYKYAPLALSLSDETVPSAIEHDSFRRMADRCGADPAETIGYVGEAVHRLREAWSGELRQEAKSRFPALAAHFTQRIEALPICAAVG